MTSQPEVVPPVPLPPTNWKDPTNVATFLGAFALFLVGLLTSLGVVLPSGTSANVSLWAGVVSQAGAVAAAVISLLSHHSVQKVALKSRS